MKATLTFNIPEDQEEYNRVNKATGLCSLAWDFEQHLRSEAKYGDLDGISADKYIDTLRDKWYEIKGDNNIHFEEIWT